MEEISDRLDIPVERLREINFYKPDEETHFNQSKWTSCISNVSITDNKQVSRIGMFQSCTDKSKKNQTTRSDEKP